MNMVRLLRSASGSVRLQYGAIYWNQLKNGPDSDLD
jgi:hypothetical protein